MAYTVHFEKAMADFDFSRGAEALKLVVRGKKPRVLKCKGPDGYVRELQHMLDSIRAGQRPTVVTGSDALSAVQICEAEERSVKSGKVELVTG
jgi:predicted dehydrogenase